MQAWWRVIRGVIPYKWTVVISMICALGVGLSYASGLVVMYPAVKTFISKEQLQGWANRTVAQARLGVTIEYLDTNVDLNEPGLVIKHVGDETPKELRDFQGRLTITQVDVDGKTATADPA